MTTNRPEAPILTAILLALPTVSGPDVLAFVIAGLAVVVVVGTVLVSYLVHDRRKLPPPPSPPPA